jgi:hypothetical protein
MGTNHDLEDRIVNIEMVSTTIAGMLGVPLPDEPVGATQEQRVTNLEELLPRLDSTLG